MTLAKTASGAKTLAKKKGTSIIWKIFRFFLLIGICYIFLFPVLYMISVAVRGPESVNDPSVVWIPREFSLSSIKTAIEILEYPRAVGVTMLLSVGGTVGSLISCSLVGYGFARFRFRERGFMFALVLLTMMVPAQVLMVPQYIWYSKLGWVGSYIPLIVPYCFAIQGFFVYMMYNFLQGIPKELDEAAKIDGCSYYTIYTHIALPLMVPALVTSGIFSFIWRWDDFMSALLYINKAAKYPVCLALKLFADPGSTSDYGAMFAMSVLSILPVLVIFIFSQKYLVDGIATSGLKG